MVLNTSSDIGGRSVMHTWIYSIQINHKYYGGFNTVNSLMGCDL